MRVIAAESTELFVGPRDAPLQLARVYAECTEPTLVRVEGDGLAGERITPASPRQCPWGRLGWTIRDMWVRITADEI